MKAKLRNTPEAKPEKKDIKELLKDTFEIKDPLDDCLINFPPNYKKQIIKGEAVTIPKLFKQNMLTIGIIKE